jgi:FkbH-like protein
MHFVTSNFNLLQSNKIWEIIKKKHNIYLDEDYNDFYYKLNDTKIINNYKTFHIFIYLDIFNVDQNLKLLKELRKKFLIRNKFFFLHIINYTNINIKNNNYITNKISNFISAIDLEKKNLYVKIYFQKKETFFNNRNKIYIKFPFEISALKEFSKIIDDDLKILNSKPYKLIILDCDNTLWGGILNEEKAIGLTYGDEGEGFIFKQFQETLKKLKNDGFLLSISSKNNEKDVWNAMKIRKMILQKKDFLKPKINWGEKYLNIKKTISELSLRPADVIFIDDNILEIKKVKKFVKKINLLHINEQSIINKKIENDLRFQKLIVLEEDLKKYDQYKIKLKYDQLKEENKVDLKFFYKLKQKINFYNCNPSNFERALQLFNKTNQFNFSLNRYTRTDLQKIIKNSSFELKLFSLNDKFGDHGIIGAYLIYKKRNITEIIDFVLSCRVLNRYVENYIIYSILKKYNIKKINIKYLNTELNDKLIPEFLKNNFFKLITKNKNKYLYRVIFNEKFNEIKSIFN